MKTIQKVLLGLTVIGSLTVAAADGAALYKKCSACHGMTGEKKALGKSAIIKGWDATKTVAALKGYQDGTYGGPMKGLMKGQVASMSDAEIEAVAKYIESTK
ncbi:MAG: c-type cytochrome [Campylobacterota bacterium]|nr:c-type cytochrome [Campylobacterota bacterium]